MSTTGRSRNLPTHTRPLRLNWWTSTGAFTKQETSSFVEYIPRDGGRGPYHRVLPYTDVPQKEWKTAGCGWRCGSPAFIRKAAVPDDVSGRTATSIPNQFSWRRCHEFHNDCLALSAPGVHLSCS